MEDESSAPKLPVQQPPQPEHKPQAEPQSQPHSNPPSQPAFQPTNDFIAKLAQGLAAATKKHHHR